MQILILRLILHWVGLRLEKLPIWFFGEEDEFDQTQIRNIKRVDAWLYTGCWFP